MALEFDAAKDARNRAIHRISLERYAEIERRRPMPRRYGTPDDENPEWTLEEMRAARPLKEVLPGLYEELKRLQGQRGPQKAPTKQLISLRIDRDVAEGLRASGAGWQTRANDALRAYAKRAGLVRESRSSFAPVKPKARRKAKTR